MGLATPLVPRKSPCGHMLTAGKSQTQQHMTPSAKSCNEGGRFHAVPVILNHGKLCSRNLTISSKHTFRNRKSEQDGAQRRRAREQNPQSTPLGLPLASPPRPPLGRNAEV